MNAVQSDLQIDIDSLLICQFCLRVLPILLLQGYVLYLYIRQTIKLPNSGYDKLDLAIFVCSIMCLGVDIFSALIFAVGISKISIICKLVWSLVLLLIFLRFIFRRESCAKYFLISVLALAFYFAMSIIFLRVVPIRYSLLIVYLLIELCSVHQCFYINSLLADQTSRQRQLKFDFHRSPNELQLLEKSHQFQHKVLSPELRYHLYLRRSFCLTIGLTLPLIYFFVWNLEDSRNSLGQFFQILIVQILPLLQYYFFACANQWLVESKRGNMDATDMEMQEILPHQ